LRNQPFQMKKRNLLLVIAFTAFRIISWGQLNIIEPGNPHVLNDSTIVVSGSSSSSSVINVDLYVVNAGSSKLGVWAMREPISLPTVDTDNDFCWVLCYDTHTNTSQYCDSIGSHDTANGLSTFNGHYFPYGHTGPARIRYTFYVANSSDSSSIIVEYRATPTGIEDITGQTISFSAPYPNPANNLVNFNYSLTNGIQSANLKIFNMIGECVQTLPLSTSKTKAVVNVQSMPSGIYICEVEASGSSPAYQKLIVSH